MNGDHDAQGRLALESVDVTPPSPGAHRRLWQGVGFALAGFAFFYGATYAFEGNRQVSGPSTYILERVPGHMHSHGVLMILLGVALVYEVWNVDDFHKHPFVMIFCGYCVFVPLTFCGSWWIVGRANYAAPWSWLAFAAIAAALILWPPPPKPGRVIGRGAGDA